VIGVDLGQIALRVIALVSPMTSVYAIRRDRAKLRVHLEAAGGLPGLFIVNIGLRAVRFEEIALERVTLLHWRHRWVVPSLRRRLIPVRAIVEGDLRFIKPFTQEPANELMIQTTRDDDLEPNSPCRLVVVDAAGNRYVARNEVITYRMRSHL
jgi:hypothetical protein